MLTPTLRLLPLLAAALSCSCQPAGPRAPVTPPSPPDPCQVAAEARANVAGLLAQGRLERTVRVIGQADQLCPSTAPATWEPLVGALAELGRTDEVRSLAQVIAVHAKASPTARAAALRAAALVEARAAAGFAEGDRERARRVLREALEARAQGRLAEAEQGFLRAWETAPPYAEALYFAGLTAEARGRAAEAQRLFDRALSEVEAVTGARARLEVANELWGGVRAMAWSKDGRYLAAVSNKMVSLRDAFQGFREAMRLTGAHEHRVTSVDFSPDGTMMASASHDKVQFWDIATGLPLFDLPGAVNVDGLRFSPDGATLAIKGGGLDLWSTATWRKVPRARPCDSVLDYAFSSDGKTLVTGCEDGSARLSDVATGVERLRLLGHTRPVNAVRFSADGKALFTGSWDGTVRAWEVATGRETRVLDRAAGPILGLSVSPDGKTLAVAHEETSPDHRTRDPLRFLDLESGRLLHELDQRWLTGSFEAAFSPDGKWHAEASGVLRVSSTATWVTTHTLGRDVSWPRSLAFSPGGQTLAAGLDDGTVRVWSTAQGGGLAVLRGHDAPVTSIAYLPDGRTLVTGSIDGTVRLWDPVSGRQTRVLQGHAGAVHAVAVSRDGKAIASAGADRKVRLWNAETGAEEGVSSGYTQDLRSLAFCGAPRRVASGALDWTIHLWDFARRAEVGRLAKAHATSVACSPDGKTLFAAAGEPSFDLWDAETGAPLRPLVEGDGRRFDAAALSPSGALLAKGSSEGLVQITDGAEIRRLVGHTDYITGLAFSPDGRLLASASHDGTIRLSTVEGAERLILHAVAGKDAAFAMTPGPTPVVDLHGAEAALAAHDLVCRVGPFSFAFNLCRERMDARGLVTAALSAPWPPVPLGSRLGAPAFGSR